MGSVSMEGSMEGFHMGMDGQRVWTDGWKGLHEYEQMESLYVNR